eukprot:TRINITY_DN12089_c0_g1_i6.p1 TRINITY_DN12089_c0_g1~~TRINITY_DN12089_c0_g1_i6.p1  ORF type:complete len:537 (-),score=144.07 TRINITY_DN12089_c0_g1_i6:268-1878(-)
MAGAPFLVTFIKRKFCPLARWRQMMIFRISILVLTYLSYMCYHASRKPISVVKNTKDFLDCDENSGLNSTNATCTSWITEINGKHESEAKTLLTILDTSYLLSYAIFMFFSGFVAERMDLRFFLAMGMMLSGLLDVLFGLAYPLGIHSIWYLIFVQVVTGLVQSSGWPGVVTAMGNWFGKGKRGLVMGIWNSHTSVGNIVGGLIAAAFTGYNWGLSFTVPGVVIAGMGLINFLFLVPSPEDVDLGPAEGTRNSVASVEVDPLLNGDIMDAEEDEETTRQHTETREREGSVASESSSAIGFCGALRIPGVMEFSLCLFFAKLVSYTFLYWLPNYIHVISGVNPEESAVIATLFDYGGIIGAVLAGVLTDKTGMSASICTIMLAIAVPVLYINHLLFSEWCPLEENGGIPMQNGCYHLDGFFLFLTGLLVNGPYALITTAVSAELGQHPSLQGSQKALATVTAIIDGVGSFGTVGTLIIAPVSSNGHWANVYYLLMAFDVCAMLLLIRLVRAEIIKLRDRGWKFTQPQPNANRSLNDS